jgi:hypothetical protein
MVFPAVKLHHLYSLNLYDELDVIFEDLEMVDMNNLAEVINTKNYDKIDIVPGLFMINTVNKSMMIIGHKINNRTYMINKDRGGDITLLTYKCDTQNIVTGVEYLYHMTKTLKGT